MRMLTSYITVIQSKLLNLVKICFLPVYSQLCDASQVHEDAMWLSDNYTAAVFVYYNTGNKEIADVRLNPCKMFCGKRHQAYIVFEFLQR